MNEFFEEYARLLKDNRELYMNIEHKMRPRVWRISIFGYGMATNGDNALLVYAENTDRDKAFEKAAEELRKAENHITYLRTYRFE